MFELHPTLARDTYDVDELKLCHVRLMNNACFPWLILVPKRDRARELIDLSSYDQQLLMEEINAASKLLNDHYSPDKLNVAALGNMVEQLHIHVIARFKNDQVWPNPIWGGPSEPYEDEVATALVKEFRNHLAAHAS